MLIIHGNYENKAISTFTFAYWFIEILFLVLLFASISYLI